MQDKVKSSTAVYDLKQRTFQCALDVMRFLETLPNGYISQTIGKQLLRSATSIGANVVEGRASSSRKDFANFYSYALKSANESIFWLELLRDGGKAPTDQIHPLIAEVHQLAKILASCLITARGRRR